VPSPGNQGEGHGSGEEPGLAAAKDSPAYGARNVQKVAAGTGEALPGPAVSHDLPPEASRPITGSHREVGGEPGGRRRRP